MKLVDKVQHAAPVWWGVTLWQDNYQHVEGNEQCCFQLVDVVQRRQEIVLEGQKQDFTFFYFSPNVHRKDF